MSADSPPPRPLHNAPMHDESSSNPDNGARWPGQLAAVDMGSNSFRLEIGELADGRYRRIDYLKETVRLGAGLDADGLLTDEAAARGLACLTRFNPDGNIDARNGGIYSAANVIPYTANVQYSFRFVVDILNHLYSVYVTPAAGSEQTVGTDFAFRSEQSAVTNLNNWGVVVSSAAGTNTVCNFTDGGAAPQGTRQSFYRVRRL